MIRAPGEKVLNATSSQSPRRRSCATARAARRSSRPRSRGRRRCRSRPRPGPGRSPGPLRQADGRADVADVAGVVLPSTFTGSASLARFVPGSPRWRGRGRARRRGRGRPRRRPSRRSACRTPGRSRRRASANALPCPQAAEDTVQLPVRVGHEQVGPRVAAVVRRRPRPSRRCGRRRPLRRAAPRSGSRACPSVAGTFTWRRFGSVSFAT